MRPEALLTLDWQVVLRRGWLRGRGRGLLALQLLAEDVAEECPDDGDAPEVLQLPGHQRHGLVQTGGGAGNREEDLQSQPRKNF